jgi:beta-lactamase regulating signal transducer with metallopeptidase domain
MWHIFAWQWLTNAAVGGLVVLALGGLAVGFCRQPVRRSRLAVLTILSALMVPWVGAMPLPIPFRVSIAPRWPAALFLPGDETMVRGRDDAATEASPRTEPGAPPLASGPFGAPVSPNYVGPQPTAKWAGTGPGGWASTIRSTLAALPWLRIVSIGHATASVALLTWWVLGQASLRRVTRGARPVSLAVRKQFLAISGPAGSRVRLLESDRIALPFTFTWTCPVILVPSGLSASGHEEALKYALAHEWSHIERRDAWAWNFATIAAAVLFYQPIYWWLRRQLRLNQDYLADDRAASVGSPEDYATCLVRLARIRGGSSGVALPAMGICDRPSNLSRRVAMLISDRDRLEDRCPRTWSLVAAAATMLAILVAAGLRADATAPAPDEPKLRATKATPQEVKPEPKGETFHYSGKVTEKLSTRPISGATVIVRRWGPDPRNGGNRVVEETRQTTNAAGVYSFTISRGQLAEKWLSIELEVEHPDYATQGEYSYDQEEIRKLEAEGWKNSLATIRLWPARPVFSRVESPDGHPLEGAEIVAYSRTRLVNENPYEIGSYLRVKTDRNGRFRVPVTTPGSGVFWIVPKEYAPEMHAIPADRRGELGTFTLKKGMTVKGRARDAQGKPLAGLLLTIHRDLKRSPEREIFKWWVASDPFARQAETDALGNFTFGPMPAGEHVVRPVEEEDVPGQGLVRRTLPGVFAPRLLTIRDGESPDPLEIRVAPHVVIEGGWIDSKGKPRGGWYSMFVGAINGQGWHAMIYPSADGKFSVEVPRGIERAQITIFPGRLTSTRYRIGKDAKFEAGQVMMLGTLDHDIKELQIVRYDKTAVMVKATTKDGRPIDPITLAGEYTEEVADAGIKAEAGNGVSTEIPFETQDDGRLGATEITPDRALKITAYANGFKPSSRTLKIPEGKTEEMTLVLEAR